jgi:hypothetical protein
MSAVSAANPGIANLSQLLSSAGSATLNSALSTPAVQSALQNAPAGDIVQLSDQALQLQEAANLFGVPASSSTTSTPDSLLLQALNSSLTGSTNAGPTTSGSTAASTAATANAASALQQVSELFGTNSSSGNGSLSILG